MLDPLARLEANAPADSMVPDRVRETYLEPMRAGIDAARAIIELRLPGSWWEEHKQRVLTCVQAGDLNQAAEYERRARERVHIETKHAAEALADLEGVSELAQWWDDRLGPPPQIPFSASAPALTGNVSDAVWQNALKLDGFALRGGQPAHEPTEVRLVYTDDALYAAFRCLESSMDKLLTARTERDSDVWEDDSVELVLNPGALRDTYYQIIINSAGAIFDGRSAVGEETDTSWNAALDVKTSLGDGQWIAELKVPFADLGLRSRPKGEIWLCNFARNDRSGVSLGIMGQRLETSFWSPSGSSHDSTTWRALRFA
jgi:hypothetical protein